MNIDYNMTADYCSDWTAIDAIREMVQNAIDSSHTYECKYSSSAITVVTNNVTLPMDVFTLGVSKKSLNAIGKYGEGFKLGMMVLTRLGLEPEIHTGKYIIKGAFIAHPFTGVDTFNLVFQESTPIANTIFMCSNRDIDSKELAHKITPFAEHPLPPTHGVEILYTRPGDIYVQGLWVCKTEGLTYGYNFMPSRIKLNRDRNMVDGVTWQLGEYFAKNGDADVIFKLIKHEALDVSDISYHLYLRPELKAKLARLFFNEYGDGARIGRPGGIYSTGGHVSLGHSGYRAMSACGVKEAKKSIDPNSPYGIVDTFAKTYKKHMRRDLRNAFSNLVAQSKAWSKK